MKQKEGGRDVQGRGREKGREKGERGEKRKGEKRQRERDLYADTMLTHVSVRKNTKALVHRHTCYSHF